VSSSRVNLFLLLTMAKSARSTAQANIRQGVTAL
jgi:hypothetical protein